MLVVARGLRDESWARSRILSRENLRRFISLVGQHQKIQRRAILEEPLRIDRLADVSHRSGSHTISITRVGQR